MKLHYLLPIIGPFLTLGVTRAIWFLAGAPWSDPSTGAEISLVVGVAFGTLAMSAIDENTK